jgi:Asp-tRNA(Asn)/Glu-tRNA(Gln) amidotransferase A subunit family amidase
VGTVIWHVTMSGRLHRRAERLYGLGGRKVEDGGENTRNIAVQRSAIADEVLQAAGAILVGAGTTSPFASSTATTGSTVGSGRGRCSC